MLVITGLWRLVWFVAWGLVGYLIVRWLLVRGGRRRMQHQAQHHVSAPPAVGLHSHPAVAAVAKAEAPPAPIRMDSEAQVGSLPSEQPALRQTAQSEPVLLRAEPPSHPRHCPPLVPPTQDELGKIEVVRQLVQAFTVPYIEADETMYRRFLRANQWDVDKAVEGLRTLAEFRKGLGPITPNLRRLISLGNKTGACVHVCARVCVLCAVCMRTE
jgi:hypothetical protein